MIIDKEDVLKFLCSLPLSVKLDILLEELRK